MVDEMILNNVVPKATIEVDAETEVANYELHTYQTRIEYEEESIDKRLIAGIDATIEGGSILLYYN